jgi:hypothetical protein
VIACGYGPQEATPYVKRQAERRLVDRGILGYLGITLPWERPPKELSVIPQEQAVGAACQGTLLSQCLPIYGEKIPVACRTCRGPEHGR